MKKKYWLIISLVLLVTAYAYATVSVPLEVASDKKNPISAIKQSNHIDVRVLAATTAESYTVPTGAVYIVFSCVTSTGAAASFWADFNGTAAIPSTDITDGSGCEVNPAVRYVKGVTTISLIAPAACIVTMAVYTDSWS